jgi:nucleoside-diphosphate-sugar epimerase
MTHGTTAAITGASGYVGSVIRSALRNQGWRSIALIRRPSSEDPDSLPFDLDRPFDPALLAGVDTLVHCAYDFELTSRSAIWRTNVRGTEQVLDAAQTAGVRRLVLVSTIAAFQGTEQIYGRAKLAMEEEAAARGAVIVRPGLVYGPSPGGMVGSLSRAMSLPVVPVPAGRSHVFTVHEDDLAQAVVRLTTMNAPPIAPLVVAHPRPVKVEALLRAIALAQGRSPRFLPVPWRPAFWLLKLAEKGPIKLPFRADSLWGLAHPPPRPDATVGEILGLTPRPFPECAQVGPDRKGSLFVFRRRGHTDSPG